VASAARPGPARPGPEIVAMLAFDPGAATATCELWLPVEPE
jgi:AraC family transcriptional regulator